MCRFRCTGGGVACAPSSGGGGSKYVFVRISSHLSHLLVFIGQCFTGQTPAFFSIFFFFLPTRSRPPPSLSRRRVAPERSPSAATPPPSLCRRRRRRHRMRISPVSLSPSFRSSPPRHARSSADWARHTDRIIFYYYIFLRERVSRHHRNNTIML